MTGQLSGGTGSTKEATGRVAEVTGNLEGGTESPHWSDSWSVGIRGSDMSDRSQRRVSVGGVV